MYSRVSSEMSSYVVECRLQLVMSRPELGVDVANLESGTLFRSVPTDGRRMCCAFS